jgi:hypothetical protein
VAYLFAVSGASSEYSPIIMSNGYAGISTATGLAVKWGYDAFSLDSQEGNITDCGTSPCTIPADRSLGTIYYRLIYRGASGAFLVQSGVQTL